jgi:ATP-dependent RNA helicase DeaD
MVDGFQDLGLSAELLGELDRLGYRRPTSIQRAAIPVLRRGGNVVLHAAGGAGATAAYGLALAERIHAAEAGGGLRALVLTPTEERAATVARELGRLGRPLGVRAIVQAPAWAGDAQIVVVPANRVVALVQASTLKLDSLLALVVDNLSAILALGGAQVLDVLLPTIPRDAQRIIVTSELTPEIEKIAEAHARRALHIPARPAVPDEVPQAPAPSATIEYRVVSGDAGLQALAAVVAGGDEPAIVFCRKDSERERLTEELKLRGLAADVELYGSAQAGAGRSVGYGAPFDAETLSTGFPRGGTIVIDARELAHLRALARQANVALKAGPRAAGQSGVLERFLDTLRRALREEDIEAQLLVIDPLLQEYSAAEVAAAATALLRKKTPVAAPTNSQISEAPAQSAPLVKLFISVGQRDGLAPREIVGAITGEAGIKGDQVGRVDIRDTFSIVEVAADVAERVIRALNGTSLRGRSMRVDFDRRTGTQRRAIPTRRTRPAQ